MGLLTGSFIAEIKEHPQDYYLTFEMYDLLID